MVKMVKLEILIYDKRIISVVDMMNDNSSKDIDPLQKHDSILVTVNIDKQGRIVIPKLIRDRHKGVMDGGQQLYLIDYGTKLELYFDFRKLPLDDL